MLRRPVPLVFLPCVGFPLRMAAGQANHVPVPGDFGNNRCPGNTDTFLIAFDDREYLYSAAGYDRICRTAGFNGGGYSGGYVIMRAIKDHRGFPAGAVCSFQYMPDRAGSGSPQSRHDPLPVDLPVS